MCHFEENISEPLYSNASESKEMMMLMQSSHIQPRKKAKTERDKKVLVNSCGSLKYCKRTQTVYKPVSEVPQISLCHVNVRSVRNKTWCISDFITDHELDFLALTETWLKYDSKEQVVLGELLPNGYSIKSLPREGDKKGGGVALIYKDTYSVNVKHVERPLLNVCMMKLQ